MPNERPVIMYKIENTKRTIIFPLKGMLNSIFPESKINISTINETNIYGIVFPNMISKDLRGEMNISSIEPDSFSLEMVNEVNRVVIMSNNTAIKPGIKKNELFTSGLNKTLVFILRKLFKF